MRLDYKVSYRKKDGSIQCIIAYKDGDKWRQRSKQGFRTQKESKPWQEETIKELKEELKSNIKIDNQYKGITYKEFKKIYLKELTLYREPNTVSLHKSALINFKKLNNEPLGLISFTQIKDIVNEMLKAETNVTTIKSYIGRLNIFFNVAVDDYKAIKANPLKDKDFKLPKEKDKKTKIRIINKAQVVKLLESINTDKDRLISMLALRCGLRAGEIAGLTWPDIDFKNRDLIINKQWKKLKDGTIGFGSLKTRNSYRKVPIPPDLFKELERYKKKAIRELGNDRLFIERSTNNITSRLSAKYKRQGFDISLHDLRHTYATNLIAIGLDFKTIAEYMGDTVEVVLKIYAHFNDEMYEAGRDRINNFL